VFVTNLRSAALARLGLDYPALAARYPRLVYAAITGYGQTGPAAGKAGYDIGAYWSRSGMALALAPDGAEPPVSRPGQGDHPTGLAAAAGIAAALYSRERTGSGQLVSTSLLRSGAYAIGSDLISAAHQMPAVPIARRMMANPLLAVYQSGDGEWFCLLGVQPRRHLPGVARAVGRPELADDPRFADLRSHGNQPRAACSRSRRAHRADTPGKRLRLGNHRGTQDARRHPLMVGHATMSLARKSAMCSSP